MKNDYYKFNGKSLYKPNKLEILTDNIKRCLKRFKIIDTWKYDTISRNDYKYHYVLSKKQYDEIEKIKETHNGFISYIFTPEPIGNVVKIQINNEIIDITDYDTW